MAPTYNIVSARSIHASFSPELAVNGNRGTNDGSTGNADNSGNKVVKTGNEALAVLPIAGAGISLILILSAGVLSPRRKHR